MKILFTLLLLNMTIFSQEVEWQKVASDLNFPEGPAWNYDNTLFVSSCYGGFIAKIQNDSCTKLITASDNPFTLKQTNGLTISRDGYIFACEYGIGAILRISQDGVSEIYSGGYNGTKFNRPNDIAFDQDGNVYFTDPKSYDPALPDGRVFRIDNKTKEVRVVAENIAFSNGLAFSPNGKYLFVCESAKNQIIIFDVLPNGSLGERSVFVKLPGGDPDGIAFDVDGNLYDAHFGGGHIYVISH
ncbi:MAG: SMP-30/gluconolactonase/LRE family protein [Bacteroidota bacterium]|nr:SMP-30/gluconolactonase/LRE family protein [Bacteroidota bacterium]